jgi:hypothetical protein
MKLDPKKFFPDEGHSNHSVQAFATPDCPKEPKEACFGIATALGGAFAEICKFFAPDGEEAECKKDLETKIVPKDEIRHHPF